MEWLFVNKSFVYVVLNKVLGKFYPFKILASNCTSIPLRTLAQFSSIRSYIQSQAWKVEMREACHRTKLVCQTDRQTDKDFNDEEQKRLTWVKKTKQIGKRLDEKSGQDWCPKLKLTVILRKSLYFWKRVAYNSGHLNWIFVPYLLLCLFSVACPAVSHQCNTGATNGIRNGLSYSLTQSVTVWCG